MPIRSRDYRPGVGLRKMVLVMSVRLSSLAWEYSGLNLMKTAQLSLTMLTGLVVSSSVSLGADQTRVLSEPQLERPTLHCLGVYWIVAGDDNRNASVHLEYRKAGRRAGTRVHRWCEWNEERI